MNEVITIGVDLAKNVFQVHGVDVRQWYVPQLKIMTRAYLVML